jgi:hypothetical protein
MLNPKRYQNGQGQGCFLTSVTICLTKPHILISSSYQDVACKD